MKPPIDPPTGAEVARGAVNAGSVSSGERFRRSDRFVYRYIAREHLLIDLHSKARVPYYLLTPTAALVWDCLGDWVTLAQLASKVATEFDVTEQEAAKDVQDFLAQLEDVQGLERLA